LSEKSEHLTHVNAQGEVHMVNVGAKDVTARAARAHALVACTPHAQTLLRTGELKKGDALAIARIAAIAATKKTPDLIPLCHPIAITGVNVEVTVVEQGVDLVATVSTADRTGIEMEALTAVTVGALNIIDMIKAVDRSAHIAYARIEHKEGGRSGTWTRNSDGTMTHGVGDGVGDGVDGVAGNKVPSQTNGTQSVQPNPHLVGVLTISDRAAAGKRADETGPYITQRVESWGYQATAITVPDDVDAIRQAVTTMQHEGAWLIITTGGTGISPTDHTPQALEPLITLPLPALTSALQATGVGKAPGALLTRTLAGIMDRTALIALPGSPGAVRDGLDVLETVREHLAEQLAGADHHSSPGINHQH